MDVFKNCWTAGTFFPCQMSENSRNMGVSKNTGTPKGWFIMENPIKMDYLEGPPLFLETP